MTYLKYLLLIHMGIIANITICTGQDAIIIKGKIIESISGQPLEYATITLFSKSDSSLVRGDVSNKQGAFAIPVSAGHYYSKIEYIGLVSRHIDRIQIEDTSTTVDLGLIGMGHGDNMLETVTITATKSQLRFDLDKKVFTVGRDVLASSNSVLDVLDQTPSVSVDPNGRVSIRGSAGITILIDGKPSVMTSAQMLQNLQADRVAQVEVITNPSAKYDAAGIAGILNIVLKNEIDSPLSGSLNLRSSYPHDYSVSLGLAKRYEKVNVFGNGGVRYWRRPRSVSRENVLTSDDIVLYNTQFTEQIRRSLSLDFSGGVDVNINANNVITGSVVYEGGRQPHDARVDYMDGSLAGALSSRVRLNDELEKESSVEYLINYERTYDEEGRSLKAYVKYVDNQERNNSDIFQSSFGEDLSLANTVQQRTLVDELDRRWTMQVDYETPIRDIGKAELGLKSTFRKIENEFRIEELQDGRWRLFQHLSNDFHYKEQVTAGYAMWANKSGKLSYQLGLRGELTNLRTELIETGEVNNRRPFFNLFPSAHVSYTPASGHELQVSYSRRVDRPRFYQLNPFFSYTDDRFISIGNPNLNPMFTNSYEVSYIKSWDNISMNTSMYHRKTRDIIEDVVSVDDLGITYIQPQNLSIRKVTGIEYNIEASPYKWWRINAGVEGQRVGLQGLGLSRDYNTWQSSVSSRFRMAGKTTMQLRYFYVGAADTIQGRLGSRSRLDFSFNRQFLEGKVRLSFGVMDILQSFQFQYEQVTEGLQSKVLERPWRRTFSIGLMYRWK